MDSMLCALPPENVIYFKLGGFFFAALFSVGLVRGVAVFRSARVHRADEPLSYWSIQIMTLSMALLVLYPVYFC